MYQKQDFKDRLDLNKSVDKPNRNPRSDKLNCQNKN